MVIKKSDNEEYDEETLEAISDIMWQLKETEKELQKIKGDLKNISGGSAERTIKEYNKAFKEKQLTVQGKEDYPSDAFISIR